MRRIVILMILMMSFTILAAACTDDMPSDTSGCLDKSDNETVWNDADGCIENSIYYEYKKHKEGSDDHGDDAEHGDEGDHSEEDAEHDDDGETDADGEDAEDHNDSDDESESEGDEG